ncbi:hypothetical protein HanPI659440_Chr06g0249521 [Helianthus annuus]|nr:hypothetical protein HanPI659440_Chr06g0249521 [Helianthus annuus]
MYQSDQHVSQSLLRGRLLRNERPVDEERLPLVAETKLLQLRQRHSLWSQVRFGKIGGSGGLGNGSKWVTLFTGLRIRIYVFSCDFHLLIGACILNLNREGFRSRLATIVSAQASSQPENSSHNTTTDLRGDGTHANTPQEIEHGNMKQGSIFGSRKQHL